jgi:hypothetical protein
LPRLDLAAGKFLTIQFGDRFFGVFLRGHFDKTEAARAASLAILNDSC